MSKIKKISGFPEYTPAIRSIEVSWLNKIKLIFSLHGFTDIETPSVELIESLSSKGVDVDKEIYALTRLADSIGEEKIRFALHYDLTVPLARYVSQNLNELDFPFRRSQIQKVWRGERPQEGRYREFLQCDVDIIDNESLSLDSDYEVISVALDALKELNIGKVGIKLNNRQILDGFYKSVGANNTTQVIRVMDKIGKISNDDIRTLLLDNLGLDQIGVEKCIEFANISVGDSSTLEDRIFSITKSNSELSRGLKELTQLLDRLKSKIGTTIDIQADMSIARGFDYYTGMICEGFLLDYPAYPSICAGGRYNNLIGNFSNRKLPGVGMSIGFTRIFAKMLAEGLLPRGIKTPAKVLIAKVPESNYLNIESIANHFRSKQVSTIVHYEEVKLAKQLRYASRLGIPYVVIGLNDSHIEVKNMVTGQQTSMMMDELIKNIIRDDIE